MDESILEPPDFLALSHFLAACKSILAFLKKALKKAPYLESIVEGLKFAPEVDARIRETVNEEGFIEDSASYELSKIRTDLYRLKEKARKSLDRIMERDEVRPVLQDSYIAMRNGRYVIPLKPNYNQYFQGIVHDYSHSLKTSFVEPVEIMDTNNAISVLEKEEKEEEKRVLRDLTRSIRPYAKDLADNLSLVADLDFHHTLALFASAFTCVRPRVDVSGLIEIRDALNPFIVMSKGDGAVPISIFIEKDKQATVISGPNADGKTVALKTTGLLVAMALAGLFIPARETPRVHLFPAIYAIMGDEQSISMELLHLHRPYRSDQERVRALPGRGTRSDRRDRRRDRAPGGLGPVHGHSRCFRREGMQDHCHDPSQSPRKRTVRPGLLPSMWQPTLILRP